MKCAPIRRFPLLLLACASLAAAAAPASWVPLRWEGGPLEVARRTNAEEPNEAERAPEDVLLSWHDPSRLERLDGTPFNCLLATWSLGRTHERDAAQRAAVAKLAAAGRDRGWAVLGAVHAGPDWREAVQAAASAGLDGVTLEGAFSDADIDAAFELMDGRGAVIPVRSWETAAFDRRAPVVATGDGRWPGLLTADDTAAGGWRSGPTSNPWVLSNAWLADALRADGSGRPVWLGHRPERYRDQPFELRDYVRAVADAAMAGGRWIVALDAGWQEGLASGDESTLAAWKSLGEAVRFFDRRPEWKEWRPQPALVLVHDPANPSVFTTMDVLNMLAVRHVPHQVLLRSDLETGKTPPGAAVLAYDQAPPAEGEHAALQAFANSGGMLIFGPVWAMHEYKGGDHFRRVIPGKGTKVAYPAPELNGDKFAGDLRGRIEKKDAAPKLYNVGTIMSRYSVDPSSRRAVLQLTEYSDYPTENVTVRLPHAVSKARLLPLEGPEEDLEIYPAEHGSEVVVPEVAQYCAVVFE